MERIAQTIVTPLLAGTLLLDFLSQRFTYLTRPEWERAVIDGIVTLNGARVEAEVKIAAGDVVRFSPEDWAEPEVDERFTILYEDGEALVVNKPANLPVHPSGRFFKRTLWYLLKESRPGIRFVSRLDRETSGLVLCAKTAEEARRLQEKQIAGEIDKRYLALVHGSFPDELSAHGILVNDQVSAVRKKRAYIDEADPRFGQEADSGERCETFFTLVRRVEDKSLVRAKLVTGRTHQIRATLCSLGFPLVGDKLYGVDETLFLRFVAGTLSDNDRKRLILSAQALHCESLVFTTKSGERVTVHAPAAFDE